MNDNVQELSNKENSQKIPRYPLNGRSSYLIDKFYIIGYNHSTIEKYFFKDEIFQKILDGKKLNKENSNNLDLQQFHIEENPKLLNEFSSDYGKEIIDIDIIMEMMFPKKIKFYFSESKKINLEEKNKEGKNDLIKDELFINENFCDFEDEKNINNKKELLSKRYNIIFSSNPQSENNSKKSINGFGYVFYKKLRQEKIYQKKNYSIYIPIIFCIISEFPFYNSFYKLCQRLSCLFNSNEIKIPLEIVIYNIIKLTPSPLNENVILDLNFMNNLNFNLKNLKEITNLKEEEYDFVDTNDDFEIVEKTNNNYMKSAIRLNNNYNNKIGLEEPTANIKKFEKMKSSEYNYTLKSRINKQGTFTNLKAKNLNIEKNQKKLEKNSVKKISQFPEKIKFDYLTGYPLIQYNLAKVLMQTLSPADVIVIFFYTFLEKDVIFFSEDIEFLSLTINSYLNLNFPLNEEKYYFNNASVSFDNFINQNSTFVGSTFTTIIGINDSYSSKYLNSNMIKLKDHIAIDLDNGKINKIEDKNNKDKSKNNKELFNYIKNVCKNKETKNDNSTLLSDEIGILYEILQNIYNKIFEVDKNNNNKSKLYLSYDDNIKKMNLKIQDSFYSLINNISAYFYRNLAINLDGNQKVVRKGQSNDNDIEEEANVVFLEEYNDNKIYIKEELYFIDELRETMKFESFIYGFLQSYNPIDLYKIPLTFTEEFISFISRKTMDKQKKKEIHFFDLIDKLYELENRKEIIIDFKDILSEYYNNYKTIFNRYIEEKAEQKGLDKIKIKIFNDDNIKYRGYELDQIIIMKYIKILSELERKKENIFFNSINVIKNNIPKIISITDIELLIENSSIDLDILSKDDLCCVNILILFALSLRYIKSYLECKSFLYSLFQNFTIFRKYFSITINTIYSIYEENISKNDYSKARDYLYLYYLCINSLRDIKIIPNESLMKIIKKFNKINLEDLEALGAKQNKIKIKDEENINNNCKLYGFDLPEAPITRNLLYIIYNFKPDGSSTLSEDSLISNINKQKKGKESKLINSQNNSINYIEPKIRFNNGINKFESCLISQRLMIHNLLEQYKEYIIDMDENKLKFQTNLDACSNILILMRNSKRFKNNKEIFDMVEKIFYIFLNQIEINNKKI